MVQEIAPERRLGALGKMARRKRIFARLREGASYEEIAGEEGVSRERIRQIVSEVLQKRAVDSGADHAKLQLDRLTPVMQLAAEAIAGTAERFDVFSRIPHRDFPGGPLLRRPSLMLAMLYYRLRDLL